MIFGVGFALRDAVEKRLLTTKKQTLLSLTTVLKVKNVASAVFADNEAGYLAGIAATKTTKTKQVGFVGGMESEVITVSALDLKLVLNLLTHLSKFK